MINGNLTKNAPDLWATNCETLINFNNSSSQLSNDRFDLQNSLYNSLTSNLSQHYEPTSKLPFKNCNKRLFILHVSIRSLYKNFETLNHELIHSLDYHSDVICLSETKLKDAL